MARRKATVNSNKKPKMTTEEVKVYLENLNLEDIRELNIKELFEINKIPDDQKFIYIVSQISGIPQEDIELLPSSSLNMLLAIAERAMKL